MCVIVDANVAHSLFDSKKQTPAGKALLKWIEKGRSIITGGQLTEELYQHQSVKEWAKQNRRSGRVKTYSHDNIKQQIKRLKQGPMQSNDSHIIALARVSRARLLYSKDQKLQLDFKDKKLIDKPVGKIYPYRKNTNEIKRFLENNKALCKDL